MPSTSSTREALLLVLSLLLASASAAPRAAPLSSSDDVVFTSGQVPQDFDGHPVSAHEGWMLTNDDGYLWYGTSPKQNVSDGSRWDWLSDSVLLYTSHDLAGWKLRATVFRAADVPSDVRQRLLGGGGSSEGPIRLERPKVLYNAARRYYVLLVSLSSLDRSRAEVGWAVSVSPWGPFKFDGAKQPDGLPSYDITVASQGDSEGWLARSVPGSGIVISKLSADFLDTTGGCATIPHPPAQAAAVVEQPHQPAQRLRTLWDAVSQLVQLTAGVTQAATGPQALAAAAAAAGQPGGSSSLKAGAEAAARIWRRLAGTTGHAALSAAAAGQQGVAGVADKPKSGDMGAPCLFSFQGKWYLLAAQHPGWAPTKAQLYINDGSSPCDQSSWRALPPPAQGGAGAAHTFDSTPAFVYTHSFVGSQSDQVLLVFFGDRWHPQDPQGPPGASYVWLPLVPAAAGTQPPDSLQLLNLSSWRLGDFRPQQQAGGGQLLQDS